MNKKALTEANIRTKFITPAIASRRDMMTHVLEERSRLASARTTAKELKEGLVAELTGVV